MQSKSERKQQLLSGAIDGVKAPNETSGKIAAPSLFPDWLQLTNKGLKAPNETTGKTAFPSLFPDWLQLTKEQPSFISKPDTLRNVAELYLPPRGSVLDKSLGFRSSTPRKSAPIADAVAPSSAVVVAPMTSTPIDIPSSRTSESTALTIANMTSKVTLTSLAITIGTHPLYAILTNNQAGQKFSKLALFGVMSRSLPSKVVEGQMRGAISVTGKNINQAQAELAGLSELTEISASATSLEAGEQISIEAEKIKKFNVLVNGKWGMYILSPMFLTPFFSQMDLLLTNGASNRAKLAGFGLSNFENSLYNRMKLTSIAYSLRSVTSAGTFGAVMVGSDKINNLLLATDRFDERTAAFLGGVSMGLINCVLAHPLTEAADHLTKETTLDKKGNLVVPNSYSFFKKEVLPGIQQKGLLTSTSDFYGSTFKGRLFPKMLGASVTFGLLQFMTKELNNKEPITPIVNWMSETFADDGKESTSEDIITKTSP